MTHQFLSPYCLANLTSLLSSSFVQDPLFTKGCSTIVHRDLQSPEDRLPTYKNVMSNQITTRQPETSLLQLLFPNQFPATTIIDPRLEVIYSIETKCLAYRKRQ